MKKIVSKITLLIFILFATNTFAQNITGFEDVKLETVEDFAAAENIVSDAATYILSNPADQSDMKRTQALQLILAWMLDNPSYVFNLDSVDQLGEDMDAKTAYIASVAQYYLNNKEVSLDPRNMRAGSWKVFLSYAENPDNKIKNTRKIKKLIAASKLSDAFLLEALK